jgi:nucleoside-diphosphate-sugar epimerase
MRAGQRPLRVVVTGVDGYLGALVAPELMRRGHEVLGIDTGYYRNGWLYTPPVPTPRTLTRDLRTVTEHDLAGADAVVHMAELSNDPVGQLAPDVTYRVNHEGSVRLARTARRAGVGRFVYMSSCSVYGVAEGEVDEESPVDPQTAYAECKALVERDVALLADDGFAPTFLRNATAFGASPRMRFDIVLNNLAGWAWTTGRISMTSDGSPWRPLVHGLDIAQAIRRVLEAPAAAVRNETFNVGSTEQNYRVREIAEIVADAFPGCEVELGQAGSDNRSYRVRFDKIAKALDGFRCEWDAARGAAELRAVFERVGLDEATFTGRGHHRLAQIQHLLSTRQLDDELFWRVA